MVTQRDPQVAVLSIYPYFAEKILSGEKRVEFRKTRMKKTVSHIVIYATSPRQKVVGFFEIDGFDEGKPTELWRRYKHIGGIKKSDFWSYYSSNSKGFVIKVGRVYILNSPLSLKKIVNHGATPQSFCYVNKEAIEGLYKFVKIRGRFS